MIKPITYIIIFSFVSFLIFSCKSIEKGCFKNKSGWNYNIEKFVDTTKLYVKIDMIDQEKNVSDLFLKQEKLHITKSKPAIKFYGNGKYAYLTETISPNYMKRAVYGEYRIYNDTIHICREYWSAQSGKSNGAELMIVNKQGLLQSVSKGLVKIYEKSAK